MTPTTAMRPALTEQDRRDLRATAHAMADAAAAAILPHFRRPGLTADNKADDGFDPVTVADRASEQAMRAVLDRLRPRDAILGEEYGSRTGTTGLTWVIDPIDGTRSFLAGTPVWGVLVAVCGADGPLLGLIDQPFTGERWTGERFPGGAGQATWRRGDSQRPIATRKTAGLPDAILFSTFPEVGTPEEAAAFRALSSRCRLTRYGLDCYAYALLAMGQIDLVVEAGLHPYDVAAPIAVIEAAGGVVTDWQGRPLDLAATAGTRVLAAANPVLHAAALAILAKAP